MQRILNPSPTRIKADLNNLNKHFSTTARRLTNATAIRFLFDSWWVFIIIHFQQNTQCKSLYSLNYMPSCLNKQLKGVMNSNQLNYNDIVDI